MSHYTSIANTAVTTSTWLDERRAEAAHRPIATVATLLSEVVASHRDVLDVNYSECDVSPCFFCELAAIALAKLPTPRKAR